MPRSFELSADYRASVEEIRAVFGDERYWRARLADSGADTATLDSMTCDTDGRIEAVTTQTLSQQRLPALVTQFHRGDLELVRSEIWYPVHDGTARAEISGNVRHAPASLTGDAALTPSAMGCRLSVTAQVHVDIPLVGGKIENIIGARLAELIAAEQRFTSSWVAA
jgi:hypothetical protein